jgi:hypothetical protein
MKHIEIIKMIQFYLVGYSYTYLEYDARNHELKKGQNSLSRSSRLSTSFTNLRYYVSVVTQVLSVFPTLVACHHWIGCGFRGGVRVVLKCK